MPKRPAETAASAALPVMSGSERELLLKQFLLASPAAMAVLLDDKRWLQNPAWDQQLPVSGLAEMLFFARADLLSTGSAAPRTIRVSARTEDSIFTVTFSALKTPDGALEGVLATAIDNCGETARTRHRSEMADMRYQVRGLLAIVRSIAGHGVRTAQLVDEFSMHLSDRIDALSRIHSKLMRDNGDVDLEELLVDQVAAQAGGQAFDVFGPPVRLTRPMVETLGLAAHELATNALKYGALSKASGRLAISWVVEELPVPHLRITWEESGVSVLAAAPRTHGFGLTFVEDAIAYELHGHVSHKLSPGGLRCEITLPLRGELQEKPTTRALSDRAAGTLHSPPEP